VLKLSKRLLSKRQKAKGKRQKAKGKRQGEKHEGTDRAAARDGTRRNERRRDAQTHGRKAGTTKQEGTKARQDSLQQIVRSSNRPIVQSSNR